MKNEPLQRAVDIMNTITDGLGGYRAQRAIVAVSYRLSEMSVHLDEAGQDRAFQEAEMCLVEARQLARHFPTVALRRLGNAAAHLCGRGSPVVDAIERLLG